MTLNRQNPFPGFGSSVAGRRVRVVTGIQTQTVNVCTLAGEIGNYDAVYRLPIGLAVTEIDLPTGETIDALYEWLEHRGATLEIKSPNGTAPSLQPLIPSPSKDDHWVAQAIVAAEQAITRLVKEFSENPYLQRVEHSLHAQLYGLRTGGASATRGPQTGIGG